MLLSAHSLSMIKDPFAMTLSLTFSSMISVVTATKNPTKKYTKSSKSIKRSEFKKASKFKKSKFKESGKIGSNNHGENYSSFSNTSVLEEDSSWTDTDSSSFSDKISSTHDCLLVEKIWERMIKNEQDRNSPTGDDLSRCCYYIGSYQRKTGIPGVYCDTHDNVYGISWYQKDLSGEIPVEIGDLKDLEWL